MTIIYHKDLIQGTDEWLAQRCGMLTASEVKHIITPTLKIASNDKERAHLYELLAQRVSKYVEPQYVSDAMLRGEKDEFVARQLYSEKYAEVTTCGFITNDDLGFAMGYSPDGLVGDDGLIEIKGRKQSFQMQTIIENVLPADFSLQVHHGLIVSKRKWTDFISFSGGMPMFVLRVWPDPVISNAITEAACAFEKRLQEKLEVYLNNIKNFHPTERCDYEEIFP
jgi:YqaJ-like viral recombinase domain